MRKAPNSSSPMFTSPSVDHAVHAFAAKVVDADKIATVECDIFSPNALGAMLNRKTIPHMHARVVAGAANNQLAHDSDGAALQARGILYAPDYVINGGGVICVAGQIFDWNNVEIERRVARSPTGWRRFSIAPSRRMRRPTPSPTASRKSA